MEYMERILGRKVRFLLPSLKLKRPGRHGANVEAELHEFLMQHFGGYTASSGNLFGYWREKGEEDSYGEHREFTVALSTEESLSHLKSFLARVADELGEKCIYLEDAGKALLIYGAQNVRITRA